MKLSFTLVLAVLGYTALAAPIPGTDVCTRSETDAEPTGYYPICKRLESAVVPDVEVKREPTGPICKKSEDGIEPTGYYPEC